MHDATYNFRFRLFASKTKARWSVRRDILLDKIKYTTGADTGFQFRGIVEFDDAEGTEKRGAEDVEGWSLGRGYHPPQLGVGFGKGLCPSPRIFL